MRKALVYLTQKSPFFPIYIFLLSYSVFCRNKSAVATISCCITALCLVVSKSTNKGCTIYDMCFIYLLSY